jgi:hypothetical protein
MDIEALILHPADPLANPGELAAPLRAMGLIGAPMAGATPTFEPGAAFSDLVSFLGCSPQLMADNAPRHRIQLPLPQRRPTLLAHRCTITPACPACRAPVADWRNLVEDWQHDPTHHARCAACSTEHAVPALRWCERAGFGLREIVVLGVSEGTAIPADALLDELAALGAGPWRHFFDWRHG